MSGVPSFQSCAFVVLVLRSEGWMEGCTPPFESELATAGRRNALLSSVSFDFSSHRRSCIGDALLSAWCHDAFASKHIKNLQVKPVNVLAHNAYCSGWACEAVLSKA